MRTFDEIRRDRDRVSERRSRILQDMDLAQVAADRGDVDDAGLSERLENLQRGLDRVDADLERLDAEHGDALREAARNPNRLVPGDGGEDPGWSWDRHDRVQDRDTSESPMVRRMHDDALRTVDQQALSASAGDRLDRIIRHADPMGLTSRYLTAVGSEHYSSAFGKMLQNPTDAHLRMTAQEAAAVRAVAQVMMERAMNEGTGSAGGYGVPVAVDPTILLSSNGAINPIRQLARVFTVTGTNKWTGVSGSVTASFTAENTEAADGTPTLAQPSVTVQKAQCFVPFSIEVGEDYAGLQQELARIIADAKDVVESAKFLSGAGPTSNEPQGILGTNSGLITGSRVLTNTIAVTAIGDAYLLKQALPARWLPNAQFLAHPTVIDVFRRFVGGGNTTEPFVVEGGRMLNRDTYEWSDMATATTTTGTKIVLFGDISSTFAIVDRIGLSVELIPHIFGATNRFPLGQRGVYAYWRVGSGILVAAASRYLEVK